MKRIKFLSTIAFGLTAAFALISCGSKDKLSFAAGVPEIGEKIYVSPKGKFEAKGTKSDPYDFLSAVTLAKPGQTLLLADGVYEYSYRLGLMNSGAQGQYITVRPESDKARVVFDFSEMFFDGTNRGIQIYGNYWYFYDIEITGAGDNGMYVAGSHNVVDNCIFYNNRDSGLQIGRAYSEDIRFDQWPSYNLIKNCTSFGNYDDETLGENADGFAAKLTVGYGNVFDGCIAFRNSDDGWDLYAKQDSGNIGTVTLYNCVSFENGYLPYQIEKVNADGTTEMTYDTLNGDGIGFKLGGSTMEGDVVVNNCLAFNNKLHGIGDNSNPGFLSINNSTAFNNCAGLSDDGTISGVRGIEGLTNKSNNFDLARDTKSYNNYYGLLSYTSNQNNYDPVGDSSYNTDAFRGSVAYSIFNNGYDGSEKYVAFTAPEDASAYQSASEDIAFSSGTPYEGLSDEVFADLTAINAICESEDNFDSLIDLHYQLRNKDYSINMGDKIRLVDEELLKYANGNPIGAVLNKASADEYTHPSFYTFVTADKDMSDDEVSVLSAYTVTEILASTNSCFQDFDIPKYIHDCDISWKSLNTDIIEITENEDISASKTVFSKAIVHSPDVDTKVQIIATITCGSAKIEKKFEVNVCGRNQELGELSSTGSDAIRIEKFGRFVAPRIYALDASSTTHSELPLSKYDLVYTYRYAKDGNSRYYKTDGVYTSVAGVYEVTATATSKKNSNITSQYVYNVYVVDPDCDIDFKSNKYNVTLSRDGFAINGDLSNIEGDVVAVVTDTQQDFTAEQIATHEDAQFFNIDTDYVNAKFIADNVNIKDTKNQYYVSFTVVNTNRSNYSKATVYTFSTTNEIISTHKQFYDIAKTGKMEGVEATSTTIYSLANDLDFADPSWVDANNGDCWPTLAKDKCSTFSGLLNGNGHTVKNITPAANTESANEKNINIFYKVQNGTIMNINFDNIILSNRTGKQVGIIGDLQGGYLHKIKLTNISMQAKDSAGGLVGQVTGGENYITQCSLVNPIPEKAENTQYVISTANKYAGGIVGNAQLNSDQFKLELSITDCMVIANIGDGKDASGNTGGILGRVKNESTEYLTVVERCYYKGTIIAKGQYNAGIVGDFDNGMGHVIIYNNLADVIFIWNGQTLNAYDALIKYEEQKYAHKNSNPIVGRAVHAVDIGIYDTGSNMGTWTEYYSSLILSTSTMFSLSYEDDFGNLTLYEITKSTFESTLGFDFENIWDYKDSQISLK